MTEDPNAPLKPEPFFTSAKEYLRIHGPFVFLAVVHNVLAEVCSDHPNSVTGVASAYTCQRMQYLMKKVKTRIDDLVREALNPYSS